MNRQRPLVGRRFGVRASSPDAMAREFAVLRGFRQLETPRTTVAGVIGVATVAAIAITVALGRPTPLVGLAALGFAAVAFAVVTFGVATAIRPRRVTRAAELYRWIGRREWQRWRAITGGVPPRTPGRARSWLEQHPARGGAEDLPRIELLMWIGEFEAARRVALELPGHSPWHGFERALQLAFVDFVATGDGDLASVRGRLDGLYGEERRIAGAMLACEDARQRVVEQRLAGTANRATRSESGAGPDWLEPLVAAREAFDTELDGFLLRDLAGWLARPLLGLGVISAATTFLLAGSLAAR